MRIVIKLPICARDAFEIKFRVIGRDGDRQAKVVQLRIRERGGDRRVTLISFLSWRAENRKDNAIETSKS